MVNVLFHRDSKLVKQDVVEGKLEPYAYVFYLKDNVFTIGLPFNKSVQGWVEVFKLNETFHSLHCPHCNSYIYNSTNYLSAPEWLIDRWKNEGNL